MDERALMTPIGRVVAESNFIALVVVDGAQASAYRNPFDEEEEGHLDFDKIMTRYEKHTTQSYFGPPVVFSPDGAMDVGAIS